MAARSAAQWFAATDSEQREIIVSTLQHLRPTGSVLTHDELDDLATEMNVAPAKISDLIALVYVIGHAARAAGTSFDEVAVALTEGQREGAVDSLRQLEHVATELAQRFAVFGEKPRCQRLSICTQHPTFGLSHGRVDRSLYPLPSCV